MGKIAEDPPAKKLPFRQVLGYGLGHVFNDICASLWFTYLLIFLQKVNNSFFCSPTFFYKYHIRDPFKKMKINLNKSQVLKFSSADAGTSRHTFKCFQKHKHLPENQVAQFWPYFDIRLGDAHWPAGRWGLHHICELLCRQHVHLDLDLSEQDNM